MDKKPFEINGHLHRWDGTRWTHAEEVCCKPEGPKAENPNEWTHNCSYFVGVGKVTLTDRSLDCVLCGARDPGDAVKVETWWKHERVWGHKHGRQTIFKTYLSTRCGTCGAERPPMDDQNQ